MLSREERTRLEAWAREVLPRALAYARSLLRDPIQAEDVIQECLLRLLRHADTYDLPRDGVKILFKAVSRLCLNEQSRRRAFVSLSAGLSLADTDQPSPEEVAIGHELEEEIAEGLAALPEMQRAALELRALGQSKEEIAEILEVSPSNAGVLVHRARQALAVHLGRCRLAL
jgi:RNA polymerase sigma-70 factor (ECF subfamily)